MIINSRGLVALLFIALTACTSDNTVKIKSENPADVHLQLGVRYLSLNKLDVAKENLLKALAIEPNNVQAHNALAFLYEKLNDSDDAHDQYAKAIDLAPDDLGVQNNYGRFLCEHGEYEKGMALLVPASANPLNDRPWLALTNAGRCQLDMGQKQQAEAYLRQALQLNQTYAPALLEMQKLSFEKGDYWAAKGFLQRYLSSAEHTSETLGIAIQTERAQGNIELANEYQKLLLEKFPLSNEARNIKP